MKASLTILIAALLTVALVGLLPLRAITPTGADNLSFTGLGNLSGGWADSSAQGISVNGAAVVGYSTSAAGCQAFLWTRQRGMVGLGFVIANSVSADGSVVAGYDISRAGAHPVRWTQEDGALQFGNLPPLTYSEAYDVSADGAVIVGSCRSEYDEDKYGEEMAFRWTPEDGILYLGCLPGDVASEALGVSADGSVVVGRSWSAMSRHRAFQWTPHSGMAPLAHSPTGSNSVANAVSADGSVVVGECDKKAFRWTDIDGMELLGALPGGTCSIAHGVSADGSIIVGQSESYSGLQAFVWDAAHGLRDVREVLANDPRRKKLVIGWKLSAAFAVSADGQFIAGTGLNPKGNREAWIACLKPLHSRQ